MVTRPRAPWDEAASCMGAWPRAAVGGGTLPDGELSLEMLAGGGGLGMLS